MPRGPAPNWRQRKEPILDSHILASVSGCESPDEAGKYAELVYAGCESRVRAEEIKRALYRSARHVGVSVHAKIEKRGSKFDVRFVAIDKAAARRYVVATYGSDRAAWPYNARRRGN